MNSISGFFSALKNFDWSALGHHILILAPFGIGCVLGIVLISKLISWLLKKFESVTYCAILGLIVASPFALLYNMEKDTFTVSTILLGAGLFIGATTFTYLFSKKTK
jgi:putative membrane protein